MKPPLVNDAFESAPRWLSFFAKTDERKAWRDDGSH